MDIVSSCYPMQFPEKLTNQTLEMAKNLIWFQFWTVWPKFGSPRFLLWILLLLVARHCSKLLSYTFNRKLMNQNRENGEKPNFGPNFGRPKSFSWVLLYILDIVASYHCMLCQGKLMNQTWENGKENLISDLILASWPQILIPNFFCRGFQTCTRC